MAISVHTFSLKGPVGITFYMLMISAIFYVLAFGSTGWSKRNNIHIGLWNTCVANDPVDESKFENFDKAGT